jgi:hypothetical protein
MVKPKEIAEIALDLWYIPADKLAQVRELVRALRQEHGFSQPIDDSDEWTREDELDFTRASLAHFDAEHPEDEGYGDVPTR